MTTPRAGLGTRGRRRPSAGRRCRALVVFLRGRARATIWRDEVDRRPRRHRRLGGRGRFGLRCRRLVVGFFGARPAEFSPQCVVAVGHCTISFGVRRRGCRPLSSINYTGSAPSHTATRVRRDASSKHYSWVATADDGLVTRRRYSGNRTGDRGRSTPRRADRRRTTAGLSAQRKDEFASSRVVCVKHRRRTGQSIAGCRARPPRYGHRRTGNWCAGRCGSAGTL